MPLYEYECRKDGTFERMQKFSDPPLAACPTCGGPVEKLLSAPAIQFKGTGWYVTDYARKSSGDGQDKGGAKESKEGAKESPSASPSETKAGSAGATAPAAPSGEKK